MALIQRINDDDWLYENGYFFRFFYYFNIANNNTPLTFKFESTTDYRLYSRFIKALASSFKYDVIVNPTETSTPTPITPLPIYSLHNKVAQDNPFSLATVDITGGTIVDEDRFRVIDKSSEPSAFPEGIEEKRTFTKNDVFYLRITRTATTGSDNAEGYLRLILSSLP